jgi:5-methylcytosine-specific restriction endonuclease McrA
MSRLDAYRTLLLDSAWRPMKSISWQRAVVLDWEDRVDVLAWHEEVVRTPSEELPLPSVVRLRQFLRFLRPRVAFSRRNVYQRDGFACQYCGATPSLRQLTLDHVIPRSRGGATSWDNIVTACGECNRRKGSRTPTEARMPLRRPPWEPAGLPGQGAAMIGFEDVPESWLPYLKVGS